MSEFAFKRTWGPTPKYKRVQEYKRPSDEFIVIAGPCSVESEEQIKDIAKTVKIAGATHLRGGLFRAGTYPGETYGPVSEKLFIAFAQAAKDNHLKAIIEVLDYSPPYLEMISQYADCFQIGCRGMQHYTLLRKVAAYGKQTFLKRSVGATIDEFLGAAEHLLTQGWCDPVLIERGSATNATHVRWDLSVSIIPAIKAITNIPILVDGSHGTGRRDLVEPMTLAGIAAGADGLLCEVHPYPKESLSDADQAIGRVDFIKLMNKVKKVRIAIREELDVFGGVA